MGDLHKDLIGSNLHIARTQVGTGDPNGVVTAGIIGEFFWDNVANKLYVAEALTDSDWVNEGGIFAGDVTGPAAATDNALTRFDTTTGKLIQNSLGLLTDTGELTGLTSITASTDLLVGGSRPITTDAGIELAGTISAVLLSRMDTTQRDALTPTGGMFVFNTDLSAPDFYSGTSWVSMALGGGDVVGPASATDNALARFDLTTGKIVQNSLAILTDAGALSGLTELDVDNFNFDGRIITVTGGDVIFNLDVAQSVDFGGSAGIGAASLQAGNLRFGIVTANTISVANINTDLFLEANGTGDIKLHSVSTGNVMIGPGTPVQKLDVNGALRVRNGLIYGSASSEAGLEVTTFASAVNHLTISNSGTGDPVQLGTTGTDTDVTLEFVQRGVGGFSFIGNMGISGAPIVATQRLDVDGNLRIRNDELFSSDNTLAAWEFSSIASAVSHLVSTNAITGNSVSIGITSSDTDVSIAFNAKGAGEHLFNSHVTLAADKALYQEVYPSDEGSVLNASLRDLVGFTSLDRSPFGNDVFLEGEAAIVSDAGKIGSGLRLNGSGFNTVTISSVTDNAGVARFNFTPGPTLVGEQIVVISGFTPNTDYNGTFIVTLVGTGIFETGVAFGTNDTGSFRSDTVGRVLDNASLQFTDLLSVEAWIFPNTDGSSFQPIVSKIDSGTGNGWDFIYFNNALRITFRKNNGAGASDTFSIVTAVVPTSVYTHVAMTYDDSTNALRVYVNGELVDSRTFVATSGVGDGFSDSGEDLLIGSRITNGNPNVSNLFDGDLSNVRVYNRILSESEIRTHYLRAPDFQSQSAIVADRWKVVDTSGDPWIDFNKTNRFPSTHNAQTVDVFSADDLPAAITAPDGILRRPLVALTRYVIHETFIWPRIMYPQVIQVGNFEIVDIVGANFSVNILIDGPNEPGGDANTPHFWGRKVSGLGFRDLNLVDVGNSGAGKSTVVHDLVGGGPLSNYIIDFSAFFNFLDLGVIWNMPLFILSTIISGTERGFVFHSSSNETIHSVAATQAISTVVMETPAYSFNGPIANLSWVGGNSRLITGDSYMGIGSAADGIYDITGVSYGGVAVNGDFFEPDESRSVTSIADASITINSFEESGTDPVNDTQVNISAYSNVKPGQTIFIDGATQGDLNGVSIVTRVADDELSFDIDVAFSVSSTATLGRGRFTTSVNHGYVEGQTVSIEMVDATYDGFFEILRIEANNTFVINADFLGTSTGTADITTKNETSIGVSSQNNGAQKDSMTIGSLVVGGNATATVIGTINVFVDLNLGSPGAVAAGNIERFTVTNTTTGEIRYDGLSPATLNVTGLLAASSSGGSQRFNFQALKNGSVLPSPDDVNVPIEVGSNLSAASLAWAIEMVTGDLFRIQVANADGTSNITIDTLKYTIT